MTTQSEALRFWAEMSNFNYVPLYFTNQYSFLSDQYSDLFDLDSFTADMETYIQDKLGYVTTMDDITANFDTALNSQLGFWQGTYFLFDPSNQIDQFHVLSIGESSVSWDSQALTGYKFDAATLTFSGSVQFPGDSDPTTVSLNLVFSVPAQPPLDNSDGTTPDPVTWLEELISFQRCCSGTVTLNETTSQVHGKDGCYTPQGASDPVNCDLIDYWNGIYNASIANETSATYPDDGLTVHYTNSTLTLNLLGGITIQTYQYFNNSFSWTSTTSTGQLVFYRTNSGLRAIAGMVSSQGQTFYIQAFYRQATTPPPAVSLAHKGVAKPSVSTATSPIVISTSAISSGVSDRLYPPQTLVATGGTAPYTWSSSNLPAGLTLTTDGQLSGIPTLSPGSYDFYVTATDSSNLAGSGVLTLQLVQPLTIKTTSLPDAISGKGYSAYLIATGGEPSTYKWEVTSVPIENGLSIDATGKISGTPSAAVGSDTAISFSVKVTSVVSGISLESESSFAMKIIAVFSATVITAIAAGILSLLVGTGLIFNCKDRYAKWKEGQQKANADPSTAGDAQAVLDSTVTALQGTRNAANVKSISAKNNASDLAQGTLVERLKNGFGETLVSELKANNQQLIDLLSTARDLRASEAATIAGEIKTLRDQLNKAVDRLTQNKLRDQIGQLQDEINDKIRDADDLNHIIEEKKRNGERLDGNVRDFDTIEAFG